MTAYHLATFRAAPLCLFLFQKSLHAMLFYEFEVFYHAHMVLGAVSLIKVFQPTTGKFFALIAKPNKSFPEQITVFFHEGTILTAWPAAAAVPLSKSLLLKVVFHRQITNTDSAVSSYFLSSCLFFYSLYSLVYSHQHILLFILLYFKT